MPNEPQIGHLDIKHRSRIFWLLFVIFLCLLPALIFYTTGYRLSFENEETSIVTTGGMYITTDNLEVDVYLDEEQVERPRLFRSAYYIQNIAAGQHRIVVQAPGMHTWVKELPVDPRIVTEASAFTMPMTPVVRPITQYETSLGEPVYFRSTTSVDLFPFATTSESYLISTSTSRTSFVLNEEYDFAESLFSTSSEASRSVFDRLFDGVGRFGFSTSTPVDEATSTIDVYPERGDMLLRDRDSELYAVWQGGVQSIPYYFCVNSNSASSTGFRYGEHVADAVERYQRSTTSPLMIDTNRLCRPEIKLNRLRQDVYFYDFFPNSNDLVLLQLEDGLYVTEIDDRAWQNTQQIYPGTDFMVYVENGVIYIKDGEYYFELMTEVES